MPADLHLRDEMNKRTREKRSVIDAGVTFNEQLPNTIKRALTKIKDETNQNEEIRKTKTFLPPISARPKSSYITNKNKKKEIETDKDTDIDKVKDKGENKNKEEEKINQ